MVLAFWWNQQGYFVSLLEHFVEVSFYFRGSLKCFWNALKSFLSIKQNLLAAHFLKNTCKVFVPFAKSENKELWSLVNPHHTRGILLTKAPKNVAPITITAYKVSVFRVIPVRVFPHSDRASLHIQSKNGKMRTRITPNTETFHAVSLFKLSFVFSDIPIMSLDF